MLFSGQNSSPRHTAYRILKGAARSLAIPITKSDVLFCHLGADPKMDSEFVDMLAAADTYHDFGDSLDVSELVVQITADATNNVGQ